MLYLEGVFHRERPYKTLARLATYAAIRRVIGRRRFFDGAHVVLGGSGGDIDFLHAAGVRSRNILVAEHNPIVLRRLLPKRRQCVLVGGDVLDVLAETAGRPIASLNLDLCGVLSVTNLALVIRALRLLPRGTAFAVTFSASRETCEYSKMFIRDSLDSLRRRDDIDQEFLNPFSRAAAAGLILRRKLDTHLLQYIAYRGVGPSTEGNIITRSMAVVIGRTGVGATSPTFMAIDRMDHPNLKRDMTLFNQENSHGNDFG